MPFACKQFNSTCVIKPQNIVLIFENMPVQSRWYHGDGSYTRSPYLGEISYVDTNNLVQYYQPLRIGLDTLSIATNRPYVEFAHLHKALDVLYFYVSANDTVLISYDESMYPILQSKKSQTLSDQYNFNKRIKNRLSYHGHEPLSVMGFSGYWRVYKGVKQGIKIPESILSSYLNVPMDSVVQQAVAYLEEYERLLTLEHAKQKISKEYHGYYSYQYTRKKINYNLNFFINMMDTLSNESIYIKEIHSPFFHDDLCNFVSYRHQIEKYLTTLALIKTDGVSDYKSLFDSICKDLMIPVKTRDIMLEVLLDRIATLFSVEDAEHYKNLYIQCTGDTLRAKKIVLGKGISETMNNDIELKDTFSRVAGFNSLIESHQGNVIYVDFWASWCAPCRSAFPEAIKLRREYEGKDVVFLYLALNDREDQWRIANMEGNLEINGHSYFIINSRSSKAIQELKIESIPRYIIYDKFGKIAHLRAPGPQGKEIREQLDKLLKE